MGGLVQRMCVESDSIEILKNAIRIVMEWDSKVSHYRTGVDMNGLPYLILTWNEGNGPKQNTPLMAALSDPEAIAHQIFAWLSTAKYPDEPDIDGSCNRGYTVTHDFDWPVLETRNHTAANGTVMVFNTYDSSFYDVITVRPAWIEYHK